MKKEQQQKVFVIGTLHNIYPQHKHELTILFELIDPDQILVEIAESDLRKKQVRKQPKEMVYAWKWALRNKKNVQGFDCNINIENKKLTKREYRIAEQQVIRDQLKLIENKDWKELNKAKYNYIGGIEMLKPIIDIGKHRRRQKMMLKNIKKRMVKEGKILILTGAGHLSFFERHLKHAIFPFRK